MKDQISALMDDEQTAHSSEDVFTAVKVGGEASECWATYHLIGDAMRGHPVFKPDFQQRLMQKLSDEPTVLAPRSKRFTKTPVLWSAAASVVAVMFAGWMMLQQQAQNGSGIAPVEIAQNLPAEYLLAHQALSPSSSAYYIQPAAYSESSH